jgi:hypothetical protein
VIDRSKTRGIPLDRSAAASADNASLVVCNSGKCEFNGPAFDRRAKPIQNQFRSGHVAGFCGLDYFPDYVLGLAGKQALAKQCRPVLAAEATRLSICLVASRITAAAFWSRVMRLASRVTGLRARARGRHGSR